MRDPTVSALEIHYRAERELDTGHGGLLYLNDIGAYRKFCKEALKGTKILFCGRGLYIFSPPRGTTAKTAQSLTDIFFSFF